jgi:hypothetical protein
MLRRLAVRHSTLAHFFGDFGADGTTILSPAFLHRYQTSVSLRPRKVIIECVMPPQLEHRGVETPWCCTGSSRSWLAIMECSGWKGGRHIKMGSATV